MEELLRHCFALEDRLLYHARVTYRSVITISIWASLTLTSDEISKKVIIVLTNLESDSIEMFEKNSKDNSLKLTFIEQILDLLWKRQRPKEVGFDKRVQKSRDSNMNLTNLFKDVFFL